MCCRSIIISVIVTISLVVFSAPSAALERCISGLTHVSAFPQSLIDKDIEMCGGVCSHSIGWDDASVRPRPPLPKDGLRKTGRGGGVERMAYLPARVSRLRVLRL